MYPKEDIKINSNCQTPTSSKATLIFCNSPGPSIAQDSTEKFISTGCDLLEYSYHTIPEYMAEIRIANTVTKPDPNLNGKKNKGLCRRNGQRVGGNDMGKRGRPFNAVRIS